MTDPRTKKGDDRPDAELQSLQTELARCKEELSAAQKAAAEGERFRELAARAQADLQNAKARVEREREEIGKFALEGFVRKLLPTIDNLQRAMAHLPPGLKDDEWAKGVLRTEQEMMRTLADIGLTRIEGVGRMLDPHLHEPLMTGPGEAGTVLEVFESGYQLNGRVLRPAKVRAGEGGAPMPQTPPPSPQNS